MSGFINPAGGLRYHLRALRYSKALWQPFRWVLGQWLLEWSPPEKTLVLVGPSAGYNLQPFLFERFERLVCLEPDPLARVLFGRRLQQAPLEARPALEFVPGDHLIDHPERLLDLLGRHEPAALLFSNVLGQLRALLEVSSLEAPALARVRNVVRQAQPGRSWASFHDRASGSLRPSFDGVQLASSRLSDDELLTLAYEGAEVGAARGRNELLDHLTEGLFPSGLPHAYFVWELEPGLFHLIEGVCSTAPTAARAAVRSKHDADPTEPAHSAANQTPKDCPCR